MFGMWIKKWSRIRGIARHKVSMVLPISLLFEQNLPPFRALSANAYGALRKVTVSEPGVPRLVTYCHPTTCFNKTSFRYMYMYMCNSRSTLIQLLATSWKAVDLHTGDVLELGLGSLNVSVACQFCTLLSHFLTAYHLVTVVTRG